MLLGVLFGVVFGMLMENVNIVRYLLHQLRKYIKTCSLFNNSFETHPWIFRLKFRVSLDLFPLRDNRILMVNLLLCTALYR